MRPRTAWQPLLSALGRNPLLQHRLAGARFCAWRSGCHTQWLCSTGWLSIARTDAQLR
jgi:hypothetical protein